MKATLEFNLDESDDRMAHIRCVRALDMALALWDIRHNLRKECEHAIEFKLPAKASAYDGMELVLEKINEIFEEHDIITDNLVN